MGISFIRFDGVTALVNSDNYFIGAKISKTMYQMLDD